MELENTGDDSFQADLNELKLAFASICGTDALSFDDLCKQYGLSLLLKSGDISHEEVEGLWLQAVSRAKESDTDAEKKWDAHTPINFNHFVDLLCLCEEKVPTFSCTSQHVDNRPLQIVTARRCMLGLLRAIIISQYRGFINNIIYDESFDGEIAKALHINTLKKTIERGLCKRGSIVSNDFASNMTIDETQLAAMGIMLEQTSMMRALDLSLRRNMLKRSLEKRRTSQDLVNSGIFVRSSSIGDSRSLQHRIARDALKHKLEKAARPSAEELEKQGIILPSHLILEHKFAASQVLEHLHNRPTITEMVERGIIFESESLLLSDEEQLKHEAMKRRQSIIASQVEQQLQHRVPLEYLTNKGIYLNATPAERGVERAFLVHSLTNALSNRPDHDQLVTKGFVSDGTSILQNAANLKSPDRNKELVCEVTHEEIVNRRQSLEHELTTRASIDVLKSQGIYMDEHAERAHKLERLLVQDSLAHKLGSPARPSREELEAQGVRLSVIEGACNPREMAHMFAARQVKYGLEHRLSLQDLKAKGLYLDSPNMKEGYDILMNHSLLADGLKQEAANITIDASSIKYTLVINAILDVHASFKVPISVIREKLNQ